MRGRGRMLLAGCLGVLAACGSHSADAPDAAAVGAPTVIATSPVDLATDVEADAALEVTFSRDMAAGTLDATTFVVSVDGTDVAGMVRYTEATRVATFQPAAGMKLLGPCTATVTTGATDLEGTPLAADATWTFTIRDGRWGTAQLLETENGGNALGPRIAVDASGAVIAVWQQSDGTRINVWTNRFVPGAGWGVAAVLENQPQDAQHPQVAIDAAGNAIAVWDQFDALRSNIVGNRFTPGAGWGFADPVETDGQDAFNPQIAIDAAGDAIVVWEQVTARGNIEASRFVPAAGWFGTQLIESDNTGDARFPIIASDAAGNATVVWEQSDGTRVNIESARFVAGATWLAPQLVETDNTAGASYPVVAIDPAGNATAVWLQSDGTRLNVESNRFVTGTGWGTAQLLETQDVGGAQEPQVAVDAAGDAAAVWYQSDGSRVSVYGNRFVPGTGWGAAELVELDDIGPAYHPAIGFDPAGNGIAVWQEFDGVYDNIWARRFVVATGWGAPQLLESENAGGAEHPQIGFDGSGNATVVWDQFDGTRTNIWANTFR